MAKHKSNSDFLNGLTPDIMEGYLKGTLSEEMRQKVKQFLDENPFEAEAMEGMKYSVDLDQELEGLNQQLSTRISSKTRKPSRYFWPVAATVSLMVISGLIIYLLLPKQQEIIPIAVNKEATIPQQKDVQATTPETPQLEQSTPDVPDTAPQPEHNTLETLEEITTGKPSRQQVPEINREAEKALSDEPAQEEELEPALIDEERVETNPEPTVEPVTREDELKLAVINEEYLETDPLATDEPQTLEETVIEDIAFEEAPAIDQNIAYNNDTKTRNSATEIAASRAAPKPDQTIEIPVAQPPVNWSDYLSRQLRYPDAARANGIEGTVKIKFQVDAGGKPGNFELVEKLGYGCDQEALKVIENGPLWIPGSQNGIPVASMAEIEIKFPANDP